MLDILQENYQVNEIFVEEDRRKRQLDLWVRSAGAQVMNWCSTNLIKIQAATPWTEIAYHKLQFVTGNGSTSHS